jgi:hypothetical protein|tara:strand:- start:2530 stop:3138 length:609 start_codon:yes stop_codon:yes gene_type:complete
MAVLEYNKPIPGSSLTSHKIGERQWERPPEIASVEEALKFYMQRLSDEEIIDDFMVAIESGVAIVPLVKTLYLSNVMNGVHSLDIGILIAPALTEYFAAVARSYDINYKLSNKDYKKERREKEEAKIAMLLQAAVREAKTQDEGTSMLQAMADYIIADKDAEQVEEQVPEEQPPEAEEIQQVTEPAEEPMPPEGAGLMARGE